MGQSNSASTGYNYTKKLYFDPEADREEGHSYIISDEELRQRLENLIDVEEVITRVYVYRCRLYWWQLTDFVMYHAYVVFKTKKWWWSIEKNSGNVTIQRSKKKEAVVDRYRRVSRNTPLFNRPEAKARGRGSVRDLIDILWRKDLLYKPYNVFDENCKHFAAIVFKHTNSEGKEWL